MALSRLEVTLSSRFQCPNPGSASPTAKKTHQLAVPYDIRAPHCDVAVKMGPQGTYAERTQANFYQGHVPDAPVLVGEPQARVLAAGVKALSWSGQRLGAVCVAILTGAVIGAAAGGVFCVGLSALSYIGVNSVPSVSQKGFILVAALYAACGAFVFGIYEGSDWANAKLEVARLQEMSEVGTRIVAGKNTLEDTSRASALVAQGLSGTNWLIQQAALELEGVASQRDAKAA